MSNYINLTLDTLGPQNVSAILNNGEHVTTENTVRYTVTCSDSDTTDYQIKIWGTETCPDESDAEWQTFVSSGSVLVSNSNGLKTIYFKLRDDVFNESETATATITFAKERPSIQGLFVSPVKLSLMDKKNVASGGFNFSEAIDAIKIKLVSDVNASHDDPSNISIPTTNGSAMWDDLSADSYNTSTLDYEITLPNALSVGFYINAKDIASVAPGDGVKIVKFFVRSAASGLWSI